MERARLSLTELAVLGLLAEGPKHGFAISRDLGPDAPVGRILTVRRPLVYRALERLVDSALAMPARTEPGDAGPQRLVLRVTPAGRRLLRRWLAAPVAHVRDMRIEFQLKLTLLQRSGRTPLPLIRSQLEALRPTLTALEDASVGPPDHVELWRRHNAHAAAAYLEHLESLYSPPGP
ncbi:MAG: PadR family transcriptional regulator [Acidimicrobiia bacterium]